MLFASLVCSDNDGIEDKFDNCLSQPNPDQLDTDRDGKGISTINSYGKQNRLFFKVLTCIDLLMEELSCSIARFSFQVICVIAMMMEMVWQTSETTVDWCLTSIRNKPRVS